MLISLIKNKIFWLILISIKLIFLFLFGVQEMPDSSSYIELAKEIENNVNSILDFENRSRMIGYSFIIYVIKLISVKYWLILLGLFQIFFSFFTLLFIFETLKKLNVSSISIKLLIILFSFSTMNKLELLILTDSIYGNLWVLIFCYFLRIHVTNTNSQIIKNSLMISLLLLFCFLIKDTTLVFLPLLLVFFSIIIVKYFLKKITFKNFLINFIIIFLPILSVSETIKFQNLKKENYKYVTLGGTTIYLYATVKPFLERNLKNFNNKNDFDNTYKEFVINNNFSNIYNMITELKNKGYSDVEILKYSKEKYFDIIQNPKNLITIIFGNLKPTFVWGAFQPFLSLSQLYSIKISDNSYWRTRLILKKILEEKTLNFDLILLVLCLSEIFITSSMFVLFLFAAVKNFRKILQIKKNELNLTFIIQISIIFYLLFCLVHLIVHIEPRYMVGTNFLFILSIILNFEKKLLMFYDNYKRFSGKVV